MTSSNKIALELHTVDYVVIAAYIVTLVSIGLWVSWRSKGAKDQFTAGHSLGWFNIGLSLFGTNIGPQFLIAMCGGAYAFGLTAGCTEVLPWVTMALLGLIFVPFYNKTKISTMPQFIKKRYGNFSYNFLSWYSLIQIAVIWMGVQLLVGSRLLSPILGWPAWQCILLLLVVATVFTMAGGLKAVVVTDSFQSILIIFGAAVISYLAVKEIGGIEQLWTAVDDSGDRILSDDHLSFFRTDEGAKYPWYTFVFGFPVLAFYYWCTDQTIVQRTLGAKNLDQAHKGVVFAAYLKLLPPLIFVLPGLCWAVYKPADNPATHLNNDEVFLDLMGTLLAPGFVGFIIAIMMAMLISSVDSGMNSFSTVFTMDIYKRNKPDASEQQLTRIGKYATLFAAILAFIIAIFLSNLKGDLFTLMLKLISSFAPMLAAMFLMGVVWKRTTPAAANSAIVLGGISSIIIAICMLSDFPSKGFWPHHLLMALILFLSICLLMIVVSLFTQPNETEIPELSTVIKEGEASPLVWGLWCVLAIIMTTIYIVLG